MRTDPPDTDLYLRVNEIKNYLYCPRIPFYTLCLRLDRETDLSRAGIAEEQRNKRQMKRRNHALHAVHNGVRHFDVPIISHQHRLVGRLDEMVETPGGVHLVDYKDTERDYGYWRLQMLAYKLAVEEAGYQVVGCHIYTIPDQQYHAVQFRPSDAARLKGILEALHQMIEAEVCPPPVDQIGKCRSCQYARFCNDVF